MEFLNQLVFKKFHIKIFLMKFAFFLFNKMALHMAVEKGNPDIVQLLLNREEIDVNIRSVFKFKIL